MIPVVTPAEMSAIDAAADEPVDVLIERAGGAVARAAVRLLGGTYGRRVAVIAGPGNNGADGRVAARRLAERGAVITLYDGVWPPDAIEDVDLVIDAAFGTGFHGEWRAPRVAAPVLAVDVPTGLDAATGVAGPTVLRAAATVTFAAAKPGHFLGDGPEHCGELEVADIGLPVDTATIGVIRREDVARVMPRRPRTAHKWNAATRIVAGSPGMAGSAHLAAAAAQRIGSGMVTLSSPGTTTRPPLEVVGRDLPDADWADDVLADLHRYRALVVGPGLGRAEATMRSVVHTVVQSVVPVVVDGDGLFALSWNESGTPAFLRSRERPTVLTPHDGEYARLVGAPPSPDRVEAAHHLAGLSGAVVLLKGATTVVADPSGGTAIVANGDERLATAGTGDVLAGLIAGLLSMGADAFEAAWAAAWIHAEAGRGAGPVGVVAGDLIGAIPTVLAGCLP